MRSRAIVSGLLFAILFGMSWAEEIRTIPATELAIPWDRGVTVNWVLPADPEKRGKSPDHFVFAVDGRGQPWFGFDQDVLVNPVGKYFLSPDVRYEDFAWLDSGEAVLCTQTQLGTLVAAEPANPDGPLPARFRPAVALPEKSWSLYPGRKQTLYLAGSDRWGRQGEVYLLNPQKESARMEKLFATEKAIGAVAGDGDTTYVAVDRLIIRLRAGGKREGVFAHPREDITGLDYSPEAGLFYATAKGIGFIGERGRYEFMKTPEPAIRLRGNSLYVLLGKTYGVIRIDGVSAFKNLGTAAQAPVQPVVEKKPEPPARVEKPLPPVESEIFCPKCRMVNDGTGKFCTNCGAKLKP